MPLASRDIWWEAAGIAAVCASALFLHLKNRLTPENHAEKLFLPLYILAGYSLLQGILTVAVRSEMLPENTFTPYGADAAASIWSAVKIFAFVVFVKVLADCFRRNFRSSVFILVGIGSFYAVFGILRFVLQARFPQYFRYFLLPESEPQIGFGTYQNQNHFAFLMLMNFGLSLSLAVKGKFQKETQFLLVFCAFISWVAILLTASRGGIICSFVAVGVLLVLSFFDFENKRISKPQTGFQNKLTGYGKKLALAGAAFAVLFFGAVYIGQDRVVQRFEIISRQFENAGNNGTFRRLDVWQATLEMIKEAYVFGAGFGGFQYEVSKYIRISGVDRPQQAHNDYLELIASGGIIAFTGGVLFLYFLIKTAKNALGEAAGSFEIAAKIGAVCALAAIAAHSLFDFGLQIMANQLYLAGILGILIFRRNFSAICGKPDETSRKPPGGAKTKIYFACLLATLGVFSIFFGAAKFENRQFKTSGERFTKMPFDADYYYAQAIAEKRLGDYREAANSLRQAIKYRPGDYALRLEHANLLKIQNQGESAEASFRQAISLAPFYGQPRYDYAGFLAAQNRQPESLAQFRLAAKNNSLYFNEVLNIFWESANGDADEFMSRLAPLDPFEKNRLADFLFEKKSFAATARLLCEKNDSAQTDFDGFVMKLLEKKQYLFAAQISASECDASKIEKGKLLDGDFRENDLKAGTGFGWRVGDLPESVQIGFVEKKDGADKSLLFIFDGDFSPSLALVSQIVPVEKDQKYRLSFKYRTQNLVSGSRPVLQLINKSTYHDSKFEEAELTAGGGEWKTEVLEVRTDKASEALEIRLARKACSESKCPVFGQLLLGNFSLDENKNSSKSVKTQVTNQIFRQKEEHEK